MRKTLILFITSAVLVMSLVGCNLAQSTIGDSTKVKSTETTKPIKQTKSDPPNQVETATNPDSTKAWAFYIQEVVKNYETLLIEAINNNDFSLIENLLIPNSNLYN